jgi:hypothetical protein
MCNNVHKEPGTLMEEEEMQKPRGGPVSSDFSAVFKRVLWLSNWAKIVDNLVKLGKINVSENMPNK